MGLLLGRFLNILEMSLSFKFGELAQDRGA